MEANKKETDGTVTVEPRVAVVGIGGAGCNIVSGFYRTLAPVNTIAINTDKKALDETAADKKVYICKVVTKGESTRGDARLGKNCADANRAEIEAAVSGHDVVFIIAGLGGGTGSGAASVVADICSSKRMMTFTIAINPFFFEQDRMPVAREGLMAIRSACPNTYVIENDKILDRMRDATLNEAMRAVNESIIDFVCRTISETVSALEKEIKTIHTEVISGKIDMGAMPDIKIPSEINI
jgi:cell division protein FtsZ